MLIRYSEEKVREAPALLRFTVYGPIKVPTDSLDVPRSSELDAFRIRRVILIGHGFQFFTIENAE